MFRHGRAGQYLYTNRYHPVDRPFCKNGILIVEFARDYHKAGNPIRESALEAGHVRLRPILMTSFAFVLGVMPYCLQQEPEPEAVYP